MAINNTKITQFGFDFYYKKSIDLKIILWYYQISVLIRKDYHE